MGAGIVGLRFPKNKELGYSKTANEGQFFAIAESKNKAEGIAYEVMQGCDSVEQVKTFTD
jgi:hypothetical protein